MVKSCTGCMYNLMSVDVRQRRLQPAHHVQSRFILRSASGLRLMRMRPLFRVVLMPSAPMNEDRLSTAGSLRMT